MAHGRITLRDGAALGVAGALVGVAAILAAQPRVLRAEESKTTQSAPAARNGAAEALARAIDAHFDAKLKKDGVEPLGQSDDAEFLRRVSIDLIGEPPIPDEVVAFLADSTPGKRERKIDELLARPESSRHWAEVLCDVVESDARGIEGNREAKIRYALREWMKSALAKDEPYDQIVRELITADGFVEDNGATGYFLAYQYDAKALTATAARQFMGLQIECAQCHDHPFADWKQEQFMGMAAFFARVRPLREMLPKDAKDEKGNKKQPKTGVQEGPRGELILDEKNQPLTLDDVRKLLKDADKKDVRKMMKGGGPAALPGKRIVAPTFIVPAVASASDANRSRREAFARMVTDPKNPYFRPTVANKIWGIMTGRLLVALTEDMSDKDAAKDKELLAILAKGVGDVKYDVKELIRAIAKTQAFGRTSRGPAEDKLESSYAKSIVRPIDGRPLARTLVAALFCGERAPEGRKQQEEQLLVRFEHLFGETNFDVKKYEESIPQALKIMNGSPMAGGKKGQRELPIAGPSAAAALGRLLSRYDDPRERVTRLYLAALCRPPRKAELDTALAFVKDAGDTADAYEDLQWALVNSSEFRFNR